MRLIIALILAVIAAVTMPACAPAQPDSGTLDRDAIVKTVITRLQGDLGKPVKLDVKTLNIAGDWALVDGKLQDMNGQPIDYGGTPFAQQAADGTKSKSYDGLLKKAGGTWALLESAIGPTDVRWVGWKVKYPEAPAQIFDVPME